MAVSRIEDVVASAVVTIVGPIMETKVVSRLDEVLDRRYDDAE